MVYFRLSLNFALFLIAKSFTVYPNFIPPFSIHFRREERTPPPKEIPLNAGSKKLAFINRQFTRNSYRNYTPPTSTPIRTVGICIGIVGCFVGIGTLIYAGVSADAAPEANRLKRWEIAC